MLISKGSFLNTVLLELLLAREVLNYNNLQKINVLKLFLQSTVF